MEVLLQVSAPFGVESQRPTNVVTLGGTDSNDIA